MPQVTVYVREDDFEKWKALEKKAQAISEMLNKDPNFRNTPEGIKNDRELLDETERLVNRIEKVTRSPLPGGVSVIKTPKDAKKAVDMGGFIPKSHSARGKK